MSATAMVDNLDSLDDKKLRAKCLEYGLPNVPVTDTSRKILLKRLRAAMTGENNEKNSKKNRRDTVHGTKIPTLIDTASVVSNKDDTTGPKRPPSRTNRRTIAVPINSANNANKDETTSKINPLQTSMKSFQPQKPAPISRRGQSAMDTANIKTIVIEEDDDGDVILMEAVENTEKLSRPNAVVRDRNSRSVSLSKTGVLTTSYSQDVTEVPQNFTETKDQTNLIESYEKPLAKARSTYEPAPIAADTNLGFSQSRGSSGATYDLGFSSSLGYSGQTHISSFPQQSAIVSNTSDSRFSTANTLRRNINRTSAEPTVYQSPAFSSRHSTMKSPVALMSNSDLKGAQGYVSSGYLGFTTPTSKYDALYNENSDGPENDDDIGSKTVDSPYLSSFARRLERLKADQLHFDVKVKKNSGLRYNRADGRHSKGSIGESFWDFCYAIEHQYQLKKVFSIVIIFMVVVFIYFVMIR